MTKFTKDADDHSVALFQLNTITAIIAIITWGMAAWTVNNLEKIEADDWNAIGLSMSAMQTMLAVLAFFGFWMIRSASKDAARDEAKKICDELAGNAISEIKSSTHALLNVELTTILNSPNGNQMIRDALRQLELAKSIAPKSGGGDVNSGDNTLSIKNDPSHEGYDWVKERGTFKVPNTNLEEYDG